MEPASIYTYTHGVSCILSGAGSTSGCVWSICHGYDYGVDCETILYHYPVYKLFQDMVEMTSDSNWAVVVRMAVK